MAGSRGYTFKRTIQWLTTLQHLPNTRFLPGWRKIPSVLMKCLIGKKANPSTLVLGNSFKPPTSLSHNPRASVFQPLKNGADLRVSTESPQRGVRGFWFLGQTDHNPAKSSTKSGLRRHAYQLQPCSSCNRPIQYKTLSHSYS